MTAQADGDSRPMWLRKAMIEVTRRGDEAKTDAQKMYWGSVWWRLHARTSANPAEPLFWSRECFRRSREMAAAEAAARAEGHDLSARYPLPGYCGGDEE